MQCNHYTNRVRCSEEAAAWLFCPNGSMVPGCYVCKKHAQEIIAEYSEKLGEQWTARPIDAFGEVQSPKGGE